MYKKLPSRVPAILGGRSGCECIRGFSGFASNQGNLHDVNGIIRGVQRSENLYLLPVQLIFAQRLLMVKLASRLIGIIDEDVLPALLNHCSSESLRLLLLLLLWSRLLLLLLLRRRTLAS